MTLPELAALAAKHVPDFKRPMCACFECDEGTVVDQFGDDAKACRSCNGAGFKPDSSPAALLMAVHTVPHHSVEKHPGRLYVSVSCESGTWGCDHDGTPESIARAALVALLRAHGAEVQDD